MRYNNHTDQELLNCLPMAPTEGPGGTISVDANLFKELAYRFELVVSSQRSGFKTTPDQLDSDKQMQLQL